jgi:hypothetical protein
MLRIQPQTTKEEKMKRATRLIFVLAIVATNIAVLAQSDLNSFPIGNTKMEYQITTEEMQNPQWLRLSIISRGDDDYTMSMNIEATGTADQLAGFGFLFTGAQMSYAGGESVTYSPLQALIEQRSHLSLNNDYILPGGGEFKDISNTEIAGVSCLQGVFVNPSEPNIKTTIAFGISEPMYMFPLVQVEELRDGTWITSLKMELIEYTFTPVEG